jgi:uncharacterized protein YjbJ (UPF0337 family)
MGTKDKASNKGQDLRGKGKEMVGHVTGNQDMEREGKSDQAKAALKDAGEKVKDAASVVQGAIKRD